MSAILIAVLAMAAISIAVYPLFKPAPRVTARGDVDARVESLLSQREATYGAIKELEFDRAQGKLGDTDYAALRAKYETKALGILQQLQAFGKPVVKPDERLLHLPNNACSQCGEPMAAADKFCRSCGAGLGARCTSCGAPIASDNKFCAQCGAPSRDVTPAIAG